MSPGRRPSTASSSRRSGHSASSTPVAKPPWTTSSVIAPDGSGDGTLIDLTALEFTELRTLAAEARGGHAGPESSILKIKGTEIQQRITELTLEAVGYYAYPDAHGFGDNEYPVGPEDEVGAAGVYFNMRKASIYGGSNEIQRNIIAKAVLGL